MKNEGWAKQWAQIILLKVEGWTKAVKRWEADVYIKGPFE